MANLPETITSTRSGNIKATETQVFDTYNQTGEPIAVSTEDYDAVLGFFQQKTENNYEIAGSLTDTLMNIAVITGADPMELVDQLKDYALNDIQQTVISLINQTRNSTSMLGFNKTQTANNLVARNILS